MAAASGLEVGAEVWVPCHAEVWRAGTVVALDLDMATVEVAVPQAVAPFSARGAPPLSARGAPHSARGAAPLSARGGPWGTVGAQASSPGGSAAPFSPRPGVEQVEVSLKRAKDGAAALHPCNEALKSHSDLSHLPLLHEPAILQALQLRFSEGVVYTLTGPVLLAVNPFREMPSLYGAEQLAHFAEPPADEEAATPHIYGVARAAYYGVWHRGAHQTVLVSGESGAGKTETTKFVMRFLALAGGGGAESSMSDVERQVLQSIPVLEAMGNAKTLRNENSSRFGKFIELQFGRQVSRRQTSGEAAAPCPPRLVGARTHTYLLEKVRVTAQQEGERSFHVFYQALAAAASCDVPAGKGAAGDGLSLGGAAAFRPEDFEYLKRSRCATLADGRDESGDFGETLGAMRAHGVSEAEVSGVLGAIVAVLHLGNVAFAAPANNSEGSEAVQQGASGASMAHACRLLGVEPACLERALCRQTRQMPGRDGGMITSPLPVAKASDSRDALARHLYGAIFSFLVQRVNEAVSAEKSAPDVAGEREFCQSPFVGLLDIFGFEYFETNSFEQLCINFTNELLQQYFNEVIFDHEAELYRREGIPWDPLDFPDNTMSVELIGSAKDGVLTILDQECQTVGGNAEQWLRKLQGAHGTNKLFGVVRQRPGNFFVQHFAGPVEYTSQTFLEKNRDELSADLVRCLKEGSDEFMRQRFLEHDRHFGTQESVSTQTGSRRVAAAKKYSVAREFRDQLNSLMQRIRTTEPHFVRCIKPNPESRAGVFHRPSVVQQLRYQGVLQAIEVSRAGYPMRLNHRQGVLDFRSLARREDKAQLEAQMLRGRFGAAAQVLFQGLSEGLPSGSWALGRTLLFLKREGVEVLSSALSRVRRDATVRAQAWWRGRLFRWRFRRVVRAALKLQTGARALIARRLVLAMRLRRAAVVVQSARRMVAARRLRLRRLRAARSIQSWLHSRRLRAWLLRAVVAVHRLQRWRRASVRRRHALKRWCSACLLQRVWRGHGGRLAAHEAASAQDQRRNAAAKVLRSWRGHVCKRLLFLPGDEAASSRHYLAPACSSTEARRELETAAMHVGLQRASLGELLAAREELQVRTAAVSRRAYVVQKQSDHQKQQALELSRWTALGMMGQLSSRFFGCDCGGRDRREAIDVRAAPEGPRSLRQRVQLRWAALVAAAMAASAAAVSVLRRRRAEHDSAYG